MTIIFQTSLFKLIIKLLLTVILIFLAIVYLSNKNSCNSTGNKNYQALKANEFIYQCDNDYYMNTGVSNAFEKLSVDVNSFEILTHNYVRDINGVYYIAPIGNDLFGGNEFRAILTASAPEFFVVVNDKYAYDKFNIYYKNTTYHQLSKISKYNWQELKDNIKVIINSDKTIKTNTPINRESKMEKK